jgi:hypothetical protein
MGGGDRRTRKRRAQTRSESYNPPIPPIRISFRVLSGRGRADVSIYFYRILIAVRGEQATCRRCRVSKVAYRVRVRVRARLWCWCAHIRTRVRYAIATRFWARSFRGEKYVFQPLEPFTVFFFFFKRSACRRYVTARTRYYFVYVDQ